MADTPSSSSSSSPSPPSPATAAGSAAHSSQYRLRVTAGTAYDASTHVVVPVNAPRSLTFETSQIVLSLCVRIRNFTGYPASSPVTSEYFQQDLHKSDQYSIAVSFVPKVDIHGDDLVFGNDFDRPIKDRLPPGFNQALKIVKWWVDPGLDGDVYADKPYLYGPALSSWNILRICDEVVSPDKAPTTKEWTVPGADTFHSTVVEEGASSESATQLRSSLNIPPDAAARKKHFLTPSNRESFTFQAGRQYQADFGNPYLDFNDFSLKLPGFSLNVVQYIDPKTHELRYVLKNRKSGEVYVVVMFTLLFGRELEEVMKHEGQGNVVDSTADEQKREDGDKDEDEEDEAFEDAVDDIPSDDDGVD